MKARFVAVVLGLIAGAAVFLMCRTGWGETLTTIGVRQPALAAAFLAPASRFAWAITAGVVAFAVTALAIGLVAGLVEASAARRAVNALRYDPSLAGQWNVADWLAAFATTAVSDRAAAMVAMIGQPGQTRRVAVDTEILLGLVETWIDRLTMNTVFAPLASMLLGVGATVALIGAAGGEPWEAALAAAPAGWLAIRLSLYCVRLALTPSVTGAVEAATSAILPLTSFDAVETPRPTIPDGLDTAALADAIADALASPLSQLAEATDTLAAAVKPAAREQTIDAALAEIRAGIERLLGTSDSGR
jgi:hypothetical protein